MNWRIHFISTVSSAVVCSVREHRPFSIWNNFNQFYACSQMISLFYLVAEAAWIKMVTELYARWEINRLHSYSAMINYASQNNARNNEREWKKWARMLEWRNSQMAPNTMDVLGFASILCLSDATRWKLFISNRLHEILICDQILIHIWFAFVGWAACGAAFRTRKYPLYPIARTLSVQVHGITII